MARVLGFSNRLFRLVLNKKTSFDRVQSALLMELGRVHDFGRLRDFVDRQICADGIWAGFLCVQVLFADNLSATANALSLSGEYVLEQLGGISECEMIIDIAIAFIYSSKRELKKVGPRLLPVYKELIELARAKAPTVVPARAFFWVSKSALCSY